MKKLMFLAGVATAMVASANVCVNYKGECDDCATTYAGTAHKVAISLKTTDAVSQKVKKTECTEAGCTYYRAQKTVKVNGYIWEQLDDCTGCKLLGENSALWTSEGSVDAELVFNIGLIGKGVNSTKIEAFGTLAGDDFGALSWAGFGSLTVKKGKENKCGDDTECSAWVKSISGGIAGYVLAPEAPSTSQKCADDLECDPIEYENCCDDLAMIDDYTAAYGTIKITYDAATAKKVAVADDAEEVILAKTPKTVDEIVVNEVTIEE